MFDRFEGTAPAAPKRRAVTTASVAVGLLVVGALSAAAAPPGEPDGERRVVKDRRMIVLSTGDAAEGPTRVTRLLGGGFLGIQLVDLTPELRAHFGVAADRGVMVARVEEESPAARAGLQVGDVITAIDGERVDSAWALGAAVRAHEAGDDADVEVWRDGRREDFRVTIEERERRKIDLGAMFFERDGETPELLEWRGRMDPGDLATLYFEPDSVERLGEALEKLDWSGFDGRALAERNRELEERLRELEKRLRDLETALARSER